MIHRFAASGDGQLPQGGLVADSQGSIYGATSSGGISCPQNRDGCGVIFKLRPPATLGGPWAEKILYKFTGRDDGGTPEGGLLLNPSTGKLYGSARRGGATVDGVIYELDPRTPWTQTVIHTFSGPDGQSPNGSLTRAGRLIVGSTSAGGANRAGIVFALNPPVSRGGA